MHTNWKILHAYINPNNFGWQNACTYRFVGEWNWMGFFMYAIWCILDTRFT